MKYVLSIGIAFGLYSTALFAQDNTLTAILAETYLNNPRMQQARENLHSSNENVAVARAALRPRVSGTYRYTGNADTGSDLTNDSLTLSVSQTLWNNGRQSDQLRAARLNVLAARQRLIESEQNILLSAVTAFMDVRAAQAQLDLNANNIIVLKEQLRAANNRFEVGEITKTDVSLTQSRLALARSAHEDAYATLLTNIANFTAIVGRKPGALANVQSLPKTPRSLNAALDIALENNPRIIAAQYDLRAAEMQARLQAKNVSPSVLASLSTSATRNGSGIGSRFQTSVQGVRVGLNIDIPIYQGGLLASQSRKAFADKEVRRAALAQANRNTTSKLQAAYARHQSARESKRAVNERIRAAKIAYDGVRQEVTLGARTTLDVLNAEQELLSARAALVTSICNEQVTAYQMLLEMGQLTAQALQLPVTLYDPDSSSGSYVDHPLGETRLNILQRLTNWRR